MYVWKCACLAPFFFLDFSECESVCCVAVTKKKAEGLFMEANDRYHKSQLVTELHEVTDFNIAVMLVFIGW